jgi:hypothetical protein
VTLGGEMRQELRHLSRPHLRMPEMVMDHEAPHPAEVRFPSSRAVVPQHQSFAHTFEQWAPPALPRGARGHN